MESLGHFVDLDVLQQIPDILKSRVHRCNARDTLMQSPMMQRQGKRASMQVDVRPVECTDDDLD